MTVYLKDPDDVLAYAEDWTAELAAGESIATSAWAIEGGDSVLTLGAPPLKTITTIVVHTDGSRPDQLAAASHGLVPGQTVSIVGTVSTPSVVGAGIVLATPDGDHFTLNDGTGTAVAFTVGGAQAGASVAAALLTDAVASTFVAGGTKGQVYTLRNRITTNQGRTLDRSLTIRVEPR
jgi:hypothetical protein